jgi:hypothetical protein
VTTEPTPTPDTPAPAPEPTHPDRLPDDHPAAKALAKANKEAETLRLKLQEIEDRDKSELQKLQEAVAERDAKLTDLPKQARTQAIRFASKATAKGFHDPEDALVFLDADLDLGDAAAVDVALDELAERKPHLLRTPPPAPKVPARPKPKDGAAVDGDGTPKGKERAAAALRQFRNT